MNELVSFLCVSLFSPCERNSSLFPLGENPGAVEFYQGQHADRRLMVEQSINSRVPRADSEQPVLQTPQARSCTWRGAQSERLLENFFFC